MDADKLMYTWEEFDKDANELAFRFESYKPEIIIGIAKGGLPLGVKLAHHFHVPLEIITVSSYAEELKMSHPRIISTLREFKNDVKFLIVDDVADTGETLQLVVAHYLPHVGFDHIRTATLFYKETSKLRPDAYVRKTDKWIVYPWER